jgi:2,4-dienoyl-CoA reductase-like NADH-dependent reductase (Old Yellow Enzyme family)
MPSQLFSPVSLRDLKLDNRLVVSPMCQYSADDGSANDWHMMHLGALSNSGAGLLIVEATAVEREGRITHGCTGLYSDENEAAMKKVIDACRRRGTAKLGIQIGHAGRKASAKRPWEGAQMNEPERAEPWQTKAPSAIPFSDGWHVPQALTEAEIEALPAKFAAST